MCGHQNRWNFLPFLASKMSRGVRWLLAVRTSTGQGWRLMWGCWRGQNPSLMWEELAICLGTLGKPWAESSQLQQNPSSQRPCGVWGPELWPGSTSEHPIHAPAQPFASSQPLSEAFNSGWARIKLLRSLRASGDGWETQARGDGQSPPGEEGAGGGFGMSRSSPRGDTSGAFP